MTHENFRQWVIEDNFCAGRPDWDKVGATLTQNVHNFERMKIRMLNGGHQVIADLGEMLSSFLKRDYRRVAEVHFEAGYVPAHKSVQAFTQACRSIAEPILDKPQNEISIARLLAQLFQVTETFDMETQPQLLLLQKTMLVSEGVGRILSPDANMWLLAQPLIEEWTDEYMGPEAKIAIAVDEVASGLRRLPGLVSNMEKSAAALARGGLKLHPDTLRGMATPSTGHRAISPRVYLGVIAILILTLIFV